MAPTLENSVVLCDDDELIRSVIGKVLTDVGYGELGEADSPDTALVEVERIGARIVVLDLALRGGHGEHLLRSLRKRHPSVRVVVFSAYVGDPMKLIDAGATAVVEKPDFARLEEVMASLLVQPVADGPNRRRASPRPVSDLPSPGPTSPSGFEPWASLVAAAGHLTGGDALLVLDVIAHSDSIETWDHVHDLDQRMMIAQILARIRREDDRVSISPAGRPVMLLLAGHPEAPGAVFDRIEVIRRHEMTSGKLVGAFSHVDRGTLHPKRTPDRLLTALLEVVETTGIDPERPLRML